MKTKTKNQLQSKDDFIKKFNALASHKHRYDVFSDFIVFSAIAVHNSIPAMKSKKLEQEYLTLASTYSREEMTYFSELLAVLVNLLCEEPRDILGELYMDLDIANHNIGQFFTPFAISKLTAQMIYNDDVSVDNPMILSESTVGMGGMVLAMIGQLIKHNKDPQHCIWVQCIDVDRIMALGCYLQLYLWHVPAQVVIGNSLTLERKEIYYTSAHYSGFWNSRLAARRTKSNHGKIETTQTIPGVTEQQLLLNL